MKKTQQERALSLLKSGKKVSKTTLSKFTKSPSGLISKLRNQFYLIDTVEGGYKAQVQNGKVKTCNWRYA